MQTKLSVFCDKVIEAGWIIAVIVAPLFFDVYTAEVFEPDKITLVRSVALLMVLAWIVRTVEQALGGKPATSTEAPARSLGDWLRGIQARNPLALPTLALVLAYLIATAFSVTPAFSLWGSYKRLQGTYSTFSYIVIFFLAASTIRSRAQLERAVTTVLLTSLPISLYGLIQHFKMDPLPWAGDVVSRVASNMGNPIFVAAYLIMPVPLAIMRFLERHEQWLRSMSRAKSPAGRAEAASGATSAKGQPPETTPWPLRLGYLALAGVQALGLFGLLWQALRFGEVQQEIRLAAQAGKAAAVSFGPTDWVLVLVALALLLVPFFLRKGAYAPWVGVVAYVFLLLTQLTTILFSQSRGPFLGLGAGIFAFIILLIAQMRNQKLRQAVGLAVVAVGLLGVAFLGIFNLPNTPLAPLKKVPYIGRFGTFAEEGGTRKVRELIWQGASNMLHADVGRTLVGYGPEAMHVAYNPYYPPDLAHYEQRNASPDRSHNETYDALVMTGVIGFAAYWLVFYSFFYYSLDLLGLIAPRHRRTIFITLMAAGLVAFLILYLRPFLSPALAEPLLSLSWAVPLLGVGVLLGYLVLSAIFLPHEIQAEEGRYQLLLIAMFAAVVAHFTEIQTGIAIASTRTHFWLFLGLTVAIGAMKRHHALLPETAGVMALQRAAAARTAVVAPAAAPEVVQPAVVPAKKGKKARAKAAAVGRKERPVSQWWIAPLILSLIAGIVLTTMVFDMLPLNQGLPLLTALFIAGVWLFGGVLAFVEGDSQSDRLSQLLFYAPLSLGWMLIFVFLRRVLAETRFGTDPMGSLRTVIIVYYVSLALLALALGAALLWREKTLPARSWLGAAPAVGYAVLALLTILAIWSTNLQVVLANVYYKQGDALSKAGRNDGAAAMIEEAIRRQPDQDYYYLFLGKAYLDWAITVKDPSQQAELVRKSEQALLRARDLNPLNTDHWANLARQSKMKGDLDKALAYYVDAARLSPHNAQIFNEWGLIYAQKGMFPEAIAKYERSLELDPIFADTYLYLGEAYRLQDKAESAMEAYKRAVELNPKMAQAYTALGVLYSQQGKLPEARQAFERVVVLDPKDMVGHRNLALTYQQLGMITEAISETKLALQLAPNDTTLQQFLQQLQQQLGAQPKP
ncbi:MAG: tetratricopeptide repeat protein [Chloroflexi bacterium]|nr:tetratricopeptide repeat protein [Chloroflexota bacterium]